MSLYNLCRYRDAKYAQWLNGVSRDTRKDILNHLEKWTVKLPTRLEFKNVFVRVNKVKSGTTVGGVGGEGGSGGGEGMIEDEEEAGTGDGGIGNNNDSLCNSIDWLLPGGYV